MSGFLRAYLGWSIKTYASKLSNVLLSFYRNVAIFCCYVSILLIMKNQVSLGISFLNYLHNKKVNLFVYGWQKAGYQVYVGLMRRNLFEVNSNVNQRGYL